MAAPVLNRITAPRATAESDRADGAASGAKTGR